MAAEAPQDSDSGSKDESKNLRRPGWYYVDLYGERLIGWRVLEQALRDAGLRDVVQECVALDRVPESRDEDQSGSVGEGREVVRGRGPVTREWVEQKREMEEDV